MLKKLLLALVILAVILGLVIVFGLSFLIGVPTVPSSSSPNSEEVSKASCESYLSPEEVAGAMSDNLTYKRNDETIESENICKSAIASEDLKYRIEYSIISCQNYLGGCETAFDDAHKKSNQNVQNLQELDINLGKKSFYLAYELGGGMGRSVSASVLTGTHWISVNAYGYTDYQSEDMRTKIVKLLNFLISRVGS